MKKKERSRELLKVQNEKIFISQQVINELSNVLLRKSFLDKDEIANFLKFILNVANCIPLTTELTFDALELYGRYQFAFYDSLIVASAFSAGYSQIITEDLQDQQIIEYKSSQLQVINPY
ncbi:PIN domain-containing protein [Spirulina sp. CS-785/01]|uniref:PIN domain-containing protein n=1 Tax=Spirulina sp. CS-785/01 TaxID=3021716 RepID=UPI00232EF723|nr:PIN domain-containing protein [Spirulina sp. CS-785/01]MDB9312488.1 PIN domain-containing protein [Spirulina sp. CS-785/01]